jgi:phenylalanyl-tRNA synthetase beta chain
MLELGKPTHAFDAAAIARDASGRAALGVRLAVEGERLETLDHVVRDLTPDTLLITDARGPLAMAGVMGGAGSEVSDTTSEVVIESAVFDPVSIRRTAFRHALRSEASLRFEKGQETRLARLGADRVAELIAAWAGGAVAAGRVDTAPVEPSEARVAFRPGRVNRLLGTTFEPGEQAALLERVGIGVEPGASSTTITVAAGEKPLMITSMEPAIVAVVPTWRRDLQIEADLAEEIARVRGYDAVPTKTPDTAMPHFRPDPLEVRGALRDALAGAGLSEIVTAALVPEGQGARLRWPIDAANGVSGADAVVGAPVRARNPLSERHAVLRSGLVGSLLDVLAFNERHGHRDAAIFEIGKGYARGTDGSPAEWWRLGFLLAGDAITPTWSLPGRSWDMEDAKAIAALAARVVGAGVPVFVAHAAGEPLHPGRAARVDAPGGLHGLVGELHPATLAAWDLRAERVLVGELSIAGLDAGGRADVRAGPPGRHAGAERDVALVVAEDVPAGAVAATLRDAGGDLLRSLVLFDVYRGAPLAEAEKSLAWRLTIRADDRALEEREVEALLDRLVADVGAAHGGRLRA